MADFIWVVSEWSECSVPCGSGTQTRFINCINSETGHYHHPSLCTDPRPTDTQECNTHFCPIDCEVSDWSDWSACSAECEGGTQTRTRTVVVPAENGGEACPDLEEQIACNEHPCPIDCEVSDWSEWSVCSAECEGGTQTRARTVVVPAENGGEACPNLEEQQACNEHSCPIDCEVGDWGEWSSCSAECGGGTETRTRPVTRHPENGGEACPDLMEQVSCNEQPCPVDCEVTEWGEWSECSDECDGGERFRTRTITQHPEYGGAACPPVLEVEPCNEHSCIVHCEVSDWTAWSECSQECGGGTRDRTRTIIRHPERGGALCPELEAQEACNDHPCPIDCAVTDWGEWSECSADCGGGTRTRTRITTRLPQHGGTACPALEEQEVCSPEECPCGNGTLDAGESCDDGNSDDEDGCSAGCDTEAGWDCGGFAPDVICEPIPDDGTVVGDEDCDDGNVDPNDGCYGGVVEDGWVCDEAEPSECVVDTPQSVCGNGALEDSETCDDGNGDGGDGCSADCLVEAEYQCEGTGPGSCQPVNTGGEDAGGEGEPDGAFEDTFEGDGSATQGGESSNSTSSPDDNDDCTVAPKHPSRAPFWVLAVLGLVAIREASGQRRKGDS